MTDNIVDFVSRDAVAIPIDDTDWAIADAVFGKITTGVQSESFGDAEIISGLRVSAVLHYGSESALVRKGANKNTIQATVADALNYTGKRHWALSKFEIRKSRFIAESLSEIDGSQLVDLHLASGALNAIIRDEFDRRGLVDPADPKARQ